MKKRTKELKKVDLETILLGAKISNVMHAHIINIFDELDVIKCLEGRKLWKLLVAEKHRHQKY